MLIGRHFLGRRFGRSHGRRRQLRATRGIGQGRGLSLLVRLLEGDVDDVVLVFAERVDVDIADQQDVDRGLVALDPLVDRGDVRRCGDFGVGEIEIERAGERQGQLAVVQDRGDADAIRHLEHEAHESRLHQSAHPDRRALLRQRFGALQAQRPLGGARPLGELADDFDRQARRRAAPGVGQEIDKDPLAGDHGVDGRPARQRQPDRRAVGVAPRRRNIVGRRFRQSVDRDIDRAGKPDHDDRTGGGHLRVHILGELEDEARVTAGRREGRLALDRVGTKGAGRKSDQEQDCEENGFRQAMTGRPRAGAQLQPKSSGGRSRHPNVFQFNNRAAAKRPRLAASFRI